MSVFDNEEIIQSAEKHIEKNHIKQLYSLFVKKTRNIRINLVKKNKATYTLDMLGCELRVGDVVITSSDYAQVPLIYKVARIMPQKIGMNIIYIKNDGELANFESTDGYSSLAFAHDCIKLTDSQIEQIINNYNNYIQLSGKRVETNNK